MGPDSGEILNGRHLSLVGGGAPLCLRFILKFSGDPGLGAVCEPGGSCFFQHFRGYGRVGKGRDPSSPSTALVACHLFQAKGGPGRREARGAGHGFAAPA